MATENIEATEQKFTAAISDFFGITEGGEIKPGAFAVIASKVYVAVFELIKAHGLKFVTYFKLNFMKGHCKSKCIKCAILGINGVKRET